MGYLVVRCSSLAQRDLILVHAGRQKAGTCRPVSSVGLMPGDSSTAFVLTINSTYLAGLPSSPEWADATALHAVSISQSTAGPGLRYDSASGVSV